MSGNQARGTSAFGKLAYNGTTCMVKLETKTEDSIDMVVTDFGTVMWNGIFSIQDIRSELEDFWPTKSHLLNALMEACEKHPFGIKENRNLDGHLQLITNIDVGPGIKVDIWLPPKSPLEPVATMSMQKINADVAFLLKDKADASYQQKHVNGSESNSSQELCKLKDVSKDSCQAKRPLPDASKTSFACHEHASKPTQTVESLSQLGRGRKRGRKMQGFKITKIAKSD